MAYINDSLDPSLHNCEWYIHPSYPNLLLVITTTLVPNDAQLFIPYGPNYWCQDKFPIEVLLAAIKGYNIDIHSQPQWIHLPCYPTLCTHIPPPNHPQASHETDPSTSSTVTIPKSTTLPPDPTPKQQTIISTIHTLQHYFTHKPTPLIPSIPTKHMSIPPPNTPDTTLPIPGLQQTILPYLVQPTNARYTHSTHSQSTNPTRHKRKTSHNHSPAAALPDTLDSRPVHQSSSLPVTADTTKTTPSLQQSILSFITRRLHGNNTDSSASLPTPAHLLG